MEYDRTPGGATFHGLRYECYMAALLYLRCLRRDNNEFYLASNVKDLGKFDDVVLRFTSEGKCRCILVQMKHRENRGFITLDQLTNGKRKGSADFRLLKYFHSYCVIERACENFKNAHDSHVLKGIDFDDCEFVIFTNSIVKHDSPNVSELSAWETLINTRKDTVTEIFSFGPKDTVIWSLRKGQDDCEKYQTFLRKLRIFSGQSDVNQLSALVRDEVEACARAQGKAAERLHSSFTVEIESWWNNDDVFLKTLLEFRREKHVDQLCHLVRDGVLSFGQHQKDVLNLLCSFLYREILSWENHDSRFLDQLKDIRRNSDIGILCKLMREIEREDSERFHSSFSDTIVNWWKKAKKKEKRSQSITKTSSPWFRAVMDHLNTSVTERLKRIHCSFQPDMLFNLHELTAIEENLNIFSPGIDRILMSSKMYAALEKDFRGKYLLMDETDVYQEMNNVLSACQSEHCRVLVIVVESESQLLERANDFQSERCKVVILTEEKVVPGHTKCFHVEDEWKLNQLTSDTQERVLQSSVQFQGAEVQLKDMCGSDVEQMLGAEDLSSLLLGQKVTLGRALPTIPQLYVPRTMCHQAVLRDEILTMSHENDVFAVSNVRDDAKRQESFNCNTLGIQDSIVHLSYVGGMTSALKDHPDKLKYVDLCQKYRDNKSVHWVERQNEFLVWRQSCGNDYTPRRFLKRMSRKCNNWPLCSHEAENVEDWNNKLLLITGQPGMGKSSLLHYLAQAIKKKDSLAWVVYLDLGKSIDILSKIKADDISWPHVLDILGTASFGDHSKCSNLERQLLKDSVEKNGNITVLLDSVDEISPVYMKHVVHIVRLLLESKVSRVWVASRTVVEEHLKQELTAFPLLLQPLTADQQHELLSQYIDKQIAEGNTLLEGKVQFLIEQTSNVGSLGRHICDVPLHAIMIADAVIQALKQDSDMNLFMKRLTLHEVYKSFFETKRKHFHEKSYGNIESLQLTGVLKREAKHFMDIHMKCAIFAVFSPEEISTFGFPNFQREVTNFLDELVEEKTGIIDGKVNNTPSFIHYTFAEYFAAMWMVKHCIKGNSETGDIINFEILCHEKYEFLRRIFDEMLTEGCRMHAAVLMGNNSLVKHIIDSGVSVDNVDKGGRLPIHLAAAHGQTELLRLLISAGSPVNTADHVLDWSPLRYAIRSMHWEAAEQLLQAGAHTYDLRDPVTHFKTQSRNDLLVLVVSEGHLNITKILLHMGYTVRGQNIYGVSPLHAAAMKGHMIIVRELLDNNADVNVGNSDGVTPLHLAAKSGHTETAHQLISSGAHVNSASIYGDTPLHLATRNGYIKMVQYLISSGANVNNTDNNGLTPLHVAAWNGHTETAQLLISSGAVINSTDNTGRTPLHLAAESIITETAHQLISSGANVNSTDNNGLTPLHLAAWNGFTETAQRLISRGAVVNSTDNLRRIPLHFSAGSGHTEMVQQLIFSGANINSAENNGRTPLHLAAWDGHTETAQRLISRGADVNSTDNNGHTSLHLAAWDGHTETAQRLISSGANVNSTDKIGQTPLHLAAENGQTEMIQELIIRGGTINSKDNTGRSPLHFSAGSGHTETAQQLISSGADVNSIENSGRTPLQYAAWDGHTGMTHQLICSGADVNSADEDGWTSLHLSAWDGHIATAHQLIYCGADVKSIENNGRTPLHFSVWNGHTILATYLIYSGAIVNSTDKDGRTPLHFAAGSGHTETAQRLILNYADVNSKNCNGWTPLHLAAWYGNTETTQQLISCGADVFSTDNTGRTPLHFAAGKGHTDTAKEILSGGADVDSRNCSGLSPLHLAAQCGHTETALHLIISGARVNSGSNSGWTPLHLAAERGHTETIQQLIISDAHVNRADEEGRTPLHFAAETGHTEMAQHMISSGAIVERPDKFRRTPLHLSAARGHTEMLQQLIFSGADINRTDEDGQTPFHLAARRGHTKTLQQLIIRGADVNGTDEDGRSPLLLATWSGHTETAQTLITSGANVNSANNNGCTSLHFAAQNGHTETAQLLLSIGAEINNTDNSGRTPLHLAAERGYTKTVQQLIISGSTVDSTNIHGQTPLHSAAIRGHNKISKQLISIGAKVNNTDYNGRTPLHLAAGGGHNEVAEHLRISGADVNSTSNNGRTPLHFAAESGHTETVQQLITSGGDVNRTDEDGWTPLRLAAWEGHTGTAQQIMSSGADVTVQVTMDGLRYISLL